jgi:CheY-like chemotaxis protein
LPERPPPKRVLVVEDESLVAMLLEDILADCGCEVVGPAATIADALALVRLGGVDLALLDVNLGAGVTSFPVADALKALAVPFIFVTSYGPGGVRADLRCAPVVPKPIDIAALQRAVLG